MRLPVWSELERASRRVPAQPLPGLLHHLPRLPRPPCRHHSGPAGGRGAAESGSQGTLSRSVPLYCSIDGPGAGECEEDRDTVWDRAGLVTADRSQADINITTSPPHHHHYVQTPAEALASSLLPHLAPGLPPHVLTEAICRDLEPLSIAFQVSRGMSCSALTVLSQLDDPGRPAACPALRPGECAVLHDSGSCAGGWQLSVPPATRRRLRYFSGDWKYRFVRWVGFELTKTFQERRGHDRAECRLQFHWLHGIKL